MHVLRFPGGPGVRVDSGVTTGDVISGAFDSLLAKLIVTGSTREDALERARRALDEFEVAGLPTVLPFHRKIVRDPAFTAPDGKFGVYTRWIETEFDNDLEPWGGMLPDPAPRPRSAQHGRRRGRRQAHRGLAADQAAASSGAAAASPRAHAVAAAAAPSSTATGNAVKAPMQATIVKVAVEEGDKVVKGDLILVLEAMKMEQPLTAHKDGTIGPSTPRSAPRSRPATCSSRSRTSPARFDRA